MTQLRDVATVRSEQLNELRSAIEDHLTAPGGSGMSTVLSRPATVRLAKAAHAVMWMRSTPLQAAASPSELRVVTLPGGTPRIVRDVYPDVDRGAVRSVADTITRVLSRAGLSLWAEARSVDVVLRPWPASHAELVKLSTRHPRAIAKDKARVLELAGIAVPEAPEEVTPAPRKERSQREAEEVARSYDPGILELPEPTPVAVMAYLDRLQGVLLRACSDLARERAQGSAWQEVVDKAQAMDWSQAPR